MTRSLLLACCLVFGIGEPLVAQVDPAQIQEWYDQGNAYMRQELFGTARKQFEKVLDATPPRQRPATLQLVARCFYLEGKFQAAIITLKRAVLLAPTSDESRMRRVSEVASGFIYYVSFKGVTGANRLDISSVSSKLNELRQYTGLPVGVGFGIRDAETAAQVAGVADAVVVGSVLVGQLAELADQPEKIPSTLAATVAGLRAAIDQPV